MTYELGEMCLQLIGDNESVVLGKDNSIKIKLLCENDIDGNVSLHPTGAKLPFYKIPYRYKQVTFRLYLWKNGSTRLVAFPWGNTPSQKINARSKSKKKKEQALKATIGNLKNHYFHIEEARTLICILTKNLLDISST